MSTTLDFIWALSLYCIIPAILLFSLGTFLAQRSKTRTE
jgi:hypothetical protein